MGLNGTFIQQLTHSSQAIDIQDYALGERETASNLTIVETEISEAGTYGCLAVNPVGVHRVTFELRVDGECYDMARVSRLIVAVSCCLSVPATLYLYPNDTVANRGDSLILTCAAYGTPQPNITWNRVDGGEFNASDMTQVAWFSNGTTFVVSSLTFCNLRIEDSGLYSCSAVNYAAGEVVEVSRNFSLLVQCECPHPVVGDTITFFFPSFVQLFLLWLQHWTLSSLQ